MVHKSEQSRRLILNFRSFRNKSELLQDVHGLNDVCFLRLPIPQQDEYTFPLKDAGELVAAISERLSKNATLVILGDIIDLVHIHKIVARDLQYHLWISIKRTPLQYSLSNTALPHHHIGALVYTKYAGHLKHTKTRLAYTYCPSCNKTTKDYGGKKHTYHEYGTLISDIWRDIVIDPCGDIRIILERFADLFGIETYGELRVYNLSEVLPKRQTNNTTITPNWNKSNEVQRSGLINGDCLDELRKLPSNSVDFAFADPPYNIKKEYRGYADDLNISEYFEWCDNWISEIARVLRPGGTFALLNIPLWSIRHFLHLEKVLRFQNWIAWDALSFPVRMIMPAHYSILCFSKGESRPLPGLVGHSGQEYNSPAAKALKPLAEGYCLRSQCVAKRTKLQVNDRSTLSDLWWDIHRLKHNTRRVDHPCQLPPQLMYRLIAIYTEPGDLVLDCFNGAGTTTLAAHQLGRRFIGIEREEHYHQLALARHDEIRDGLDPFRKVERALTAKNSRVARLQKQKYEVPKKTLQLEVRRVAQLLGHLPSREEMIEHGQYPIRYYDEYFTSWGEVCAAARTTGMTETKEKYPETTFSQKRLF